MEKNSSTSKSTALLNSSIALLLATTTVSPATAQTGTKLVVPTTPQTTILQPNNAYLFPMDASDHKVAMARRGGLGGARDILYGRQSRPVVPMKDEALGNLKMLIAKREFSTWFRFTDEVMRGADSPASNLKALVKPVASPQEGYMAKLMMIRQAKFTVDATYYIFTSDEAGLALVNEMKMAVRRGVNVRVLVDSMGSVSASIKGNPHFRTLLEDAKQNAGFMLNPQTGERTNIRAKAEVVIFNAVTNIPAWFRSRGIERVNLLNRTFLKDSKSYMDLAVTHWNVNRRTHDKILVTDSHFPELSVGIMGGRNISNSYYELDPKQASFRDIEVIVRNDQKLVRTMSRKQSIGEALNQQFDRLYFHRANSEMNLGLVDYVFEQRRQAEKMEAATVLVEKVTKKTMNALGEDFSSSEFGKNYLSKGFATQSVSFVNSTHNLVRDLKKLAATVKESISVEEYEKIIADASKLENQQSLLSRMILLAAQETKSMTVVSPYLWLSPRDVRFITDWLSKDTSRRFTVITNSIVTSDNMPAQALVDTETVPNLMKDPRFHPQIRVYEYGRADDVDLGGTKRYAKLHAKGVYFESLQTSLITTHNKDPRSQMLNSESGVIISDGAYSQTMQLEISDLISKSHIWGSAEFHQIRSSPYLSKTKKVILKYQRELYNVIERFDMWWML